MNQRLSVALIVLSIAVPTVVNGQSTELEAPKSVHPLVDYPVHPLLDLNDPEATLAHKATVEQKLQERMAARREVCDSATCVEIVESKMHPLQDPDDPEADREYREFLTKYHEDLWCKSESCEVRAIEAEQVEE